ncbi:unnamed protein product [Caenorhabditis auriculariae]|uniref:Uncharacterized protein n=1 Tax=Caenorhabditis auriculariae TaxID=2777116 RepID=A0A8S1H4Y2_9PELO|nr:unnamed protein product [Caenorhabditis auriculariae]
MAPSTASNSICCCFRRDDETRRQRTDGSSKVVEHLQVPQVVLNSPEKSSTASPSVIFVEEEFATARTSRITNTKFLSMKELMRTVRIEEGLEVTPQGTARGPNTQPSTSSVTHQPLNVVTLIRSPGPKRFRKAVFSEDGDITARTTSTPTRSARNQHRFSIGSLGAPVLEVSIPAKSSTVVRLASAVPQLVFAMITVAYAYIAGVFTSLGRFVVK